MAVGYKSRRVEVFSRGAAPSGPTAPLALAFTRMPPTGLRLCRRGGAVYLAVLAEELLWYEVDDSASNFPGQSRIAAEGG